MEEGTLSGEYFRRSDGTLLTKDCPIGMKRSVAAQIAIYLLAAMLPIFGIVVGYYIGDLGERVCSKPPIRDTQPLKRAISRDCLLLQPNTRTSR